MASPRYVAEVLRSASEACKISIQDVDLTRYQDPPADTPFPLEYAFHLLGNVHDKVVLDLGCGSGESVVPLCQRGAKVVGIDISPDLIAIAKRRLCRYGVSADLRVGSAYETGLPNESIDVVFCMSLLHHLEINRAMREILRIVRARGRFILKEPVRFSWTAKQLRRLFPAKQDISEYEYPLSFRQVESLKEGFTVSAIRYFRTPLVPMLVRIVNVRQRPLLWIRDARLLSRYPVARHCTTVVVMSMER